VILFLSRKLNKNVYPNCERGKCVFAELLFQVVPFGKVLISSHSTAPDIAEATQELVAGWEHQGLALKLARRRTAPCPHSITSREIFSQMKLLL